MAEKYWSGDVPTKCEVSGRPLNGVMYDANIPGLGWALICYDTFNERGCALGVGRGQKYRLQDDGRWLKVEG